MKNQADPATQLQNAIRVSSPAGTEIIQLSLRASSEHEAKTLLDAVVNAYIRIAADSQKKEVAENGRMDNDVKSPPQVDVLQTAQVVP